MSSYLQLTSRLSLTNDIFGAVYGVSWGLLGSLAVTALIFTSVRAALLGRAQDTIQFGFQLFIVVLVLSLYDQIFWTLANAAESLTAFFADNAGLRGHWYRIFSELEARFETEDTGVLDRWLGVAQGGVLYVAVSVSYFLQFLAFDFIRALTAAFAGILRVLGPLLVVGGVFSGGATLRQWFTALLHVLVWPVLPPFMMWMTVASVGPAVASDNMAFAIAQNLLLALLTFLTPVFVSLLLGRSGMTTLGAAAIGFAFRAAWKPVHGMLQRAGGAGGPAAAWGGGIGAMSGMSAPGRGAARPGDAMEQMGAVAPPASFGRDRPAASPSTSRGERPKDQSR